jgi:hypothetical protein
VQQMMAVRSKEAVGEAIMEITSSIRCFEDCGLHREWSDLGSTEFGSV